MATQALRAAYGHACKGPVAATGLLGLQQALGPIHKDLDRAASPFEQHQGCKLKQLGNGQAGQRTAEQQKTVGSEQKVFPGKLSSTIFGQPDIIF